VRTGSLRQQQDLVVLRLDAVVVALLPGAASDVLGV
jgi:hypothetical protein